MLWVDPFLARKKGTGGVEIGADEVPGTPLYGAKVDVLTDTEMYQVGVSGLTIKDKFYNDGFPAVAEAIKKASDAYPSRPYKFAFCNNNWTPDAATLTDLNLALDAVYGATPHHVFTAADFVHIPLQ